MAEDRIPVLMSQKIIEFIERNKQMNSQSIALFLKCADTSIYRIRRGEVGFSLKQLLTLVRILGIDVLSIPEDASPELREEYEAYKFIMSG